ncbi:MAG: TVP38/TMEM64 family protein [Nitrospirae bacterium]|nr:TVP38/TMEM64 family protein [Nitrospirota bacterium]
MGRRRIIKGLALAALVVILFMVEYHWKLSSYVSQDRVLQVLSSSGSFAPLVYIALMAVTELSPFPNMPMEVAAGAYFGPVLGTIYSVLGTTAGAIISFSIARLLGRDIIERFLGGHINFCTACSDKLLFKVVVFSRIMPVISFDIISYGAGLTMMSLRSFALATLVGFVPLAFVYNYFGTILVVNTGVAISFGVVMVAIFFLLPLWIERNNILRLRPLFPHLQKSSLQEGERAVTTGQGEKSV